MDNKKILNQHTRIIIYNYIAENPGLHIRKLSRNLKISKNNLEYHLDCLKKNDIIIIKKEKGYSRVYITKKIGLNEKEVIKFLRNDTTRKILVCILWRFGCSLKELSEHLEKPPSSIFFHLKKLIENDILEPAIIKDGGIYDEVNKNLFGRHITGRETFYVLKDYDLVYHTASKYKYELLDEKSIDALFLREVPTDERNVRIKDFDDIVDFIAEELNKIIPMPFCC